MRAPYVSPMSATNCVTDSDLASRSQVSVHMWRYARPSRRRALDVGIALLLTLACSTGDQPLPAGPDRPRVESIAVFPPALIITPDAGVVQLEARVTVSGDASRAVTWESSQPSVVAVAADGTLSVARCGPLGTTTITARSVADPSRFAVSNVTVLESRDSRVALVLIIDAASTHPIDVNRVSGTIVATAVIGPRWVECGIVRSVEAIVTASDGRNSIYQRPITPGVMFAEFVIPTAGAGGLPNGPTRIAVRAVGPAGQIMETSPDFGFRIENPPPLSEPR